MNGMHFWALFCHWSWDRLCNVSSTNVNDLCYMATGQTAGIPTRPNWIGLRENLRTKSLYVSICDGKTHGFLLMFLEANSVIITLQKRNQAFPSTLGNHACSTSFCWFTGGYQLENILCIYQTIHLSIYPSIYLSIYRSIHLSIYLSIHPFIHPSIHPSILYNYVYIYILIYIYISFLT